MSASVTSPDEWAARALAGAKWLLVQPMAFDPSHAAGMEAMGKVIAAIAVAMGPVELEEPGDLAISAMPTRALAWSMFGMARAAPGTATPRLVDEVRSRIDEATRGTSTDHALSLDDAAITGLAALEAGDESLAECAAVFCRSAATVPSDEARSLFAASAYLAAWFEEAGDDDDLVAAIELHDRGVACGDAVWPASGAMAGLAGASLFRITGEAAFRATAERVADAVCARQGPDGSWDIGGAPAAEVTAELTLVLADMADAVRERSALDRALNVERGA